MLISTLTCRGQQTERRRHQHVIRGQTFGGMGRDLVDSRGQLAPPLTLSRAWHTHARPTLASPPTHHLSSPLTGSSTRGWYLCVERKAPEQKDQTVTRRQEAQMSLSSPGRRTPTRPGVHAVPSVPISTVSAWCYNISEEKNTCAKAYPSNWNSGY